MMLDPKSTEASRSPMRDLRRRLVGIAVILAGLPLSRVAPGSEPGQTAVKRTQATLRLVDYRGPGLADLAIAPLICDGDKATEWIVKGLSKTAHGAPFGFVFEFADGAEHDLVGVNVCSAAFEKGQRANTFEIWIDREGSSSLSELLYTGTQQSEAPDQSHVFPRSVRIRRFLFKLLTNHGDREVAQVNEVSPITDSAASSGALAARRASEDLPFAAPEAPDSDYAGQFPYNKLVPPAVPETSSEPTPGLIDRYLLARLSEKGLTFAPPAPREILLRRLTYDLTGLPPSLEEIEAFVADRSPVAYEKVVDRLLASPRFGERWAQHWLDVVQYADTDGYAADGLRKSAWRYRDYVIRAFNDDKPFDRFLSEQLAADELDPTNLEIQPALGFIRLPPFRTNSGNQNFERNRQEFLTTVTDTVGSVFLAMTVGCARCHDHKIDPIPQTDYYRLQAYFASTVPANLPLASTEAVDEWNRQSSTVSETLAELDARRTRLLSSANRRALERKLASYPEETRIAVLTAPEERGPEQSSRAMAVEKAVMPDDKEVKQALTPEEARELASIEREQKKVKATLPAPLPDAWGIKEREEAVPRTYVLRRGQIDLKNAWVEPRVPGILPEADQSRPQSSSEGESTTAAERPVSRRLALARWLTGPGRSRTARVIVNRLWQHHFGQGIIATPSDFGEMGSPPSHRELLDWLASDLIQSGWSLKRIHRQIVLSRAYQQTSEERPDGLAADPGNSLLWRANRRRLSAEEIRDSLLFLNERLNPAQGGPGVIPPLSQEAIKNVKRWPVTPDRAAHNRRSVYLFVERNFRIPMLEAFDQPDTMTACPKRVQSVHALQSLALMNNEWTVAQAAALAGRIEASACDSDRERISRAYRLVTARSPAPEEIQIAETFLREGRAAGLSAVDAMSDLCLVLVNLNRFLYID